jgi:hypothetical protein
MLFRVGIGLFGGWGVMGIRGVRFQLGIQAKSGTARGSRRAPLAALTQPASQSRFLPEQPTCATILAEFFVDG